jgi:hypothetical protein
VAAAGGYATVLAQISTLVESARRASARSVNAIMTVTYFLLGRTVVEHEQKGRARAGYGEQLLERLAADQPSVSGVGFRPRTLRPCAFST